MSAPLRLQTHVWNPLGVRRALLLHGAGSDGGCWWRLASELADAGWLVVAPDLRSHGRSPTAHDHRLAVLASDVALLGDGYELVVGHSLGGAIAAHLLTDPGYGAAAVLVDPALRLDAAAHQRLRRRLRDDVDDPQFTTVRARHPGWDERDLHREVLAARSVTPDVIDAVFASNDPWDVVDLAASWHGRVHLLAADPDRGGLLTRAVLSGVVDGERVTGQVVAGAGHSIHRERPDVVSDAVATVVS